MSIELWGCFGGDEEEQKSLLCFVLVSNIWLAESYLLYTVVLVYGLVMFLFHFVLFFNLLILMLVLCCTVTSDDKVFYI